MKLRNKTVVLQLYVHTAMLLIILKSYLLQFIISTF